MSKISIEEIRSRGIWEGSENYRIEPRTRMADYSTALSLEVFDPLWMLCRQWQYGRFEANDCGTAVKVKVHSTRKSIDSVTHDGKVKAFSTEKPLEYEVEKRNHAITPAIRIESALHLQRMLSSKLGKSKSEEINALLRTRYPLQDFSFSTGDSIEDLKVSENDRLKQLWAVYGRRCFDGAAVFEDKDLSIGAEANSILALYRNWYREKYIPVSAEPDSFDFWNENKLAYELGITAGNDRYEAEDYSSGRLSWYNFDHAGQTTGKDSKALDKLLSYLPSPATFPCAPKRRLWEFENQAVQFGNYSNQDVSQLASAVIMQYTSMYSNDWMVIPLEAELGTILDVKGIVIEDTFGEHLFLNRTPEEVDCQSKDTGFCNRWALFSNSRLSAYSPDAANNDFSTSRGLLFAPTVLRTEESQPLEEVHFLRDEMTNMIWGIESIIPDGCSGTFNGDSFSEKILEAVDRQNGNDVQPEESAEYSYLFQNRVPVNWIPFIPQHIKGSTRETVFRRGRMPIWYNGKYCSVRPSGEILACVKEKFISNGKECERIKARFLNEEEVLGYGTKVTRTAQMTRWIKGRKFRWSGFTKKNSGYQANSGLMFDELIKVEK